MPHFSTRALLEVSRRLRAYLKLEAGLTRGRVPGEGPFPKGVETPMLERGAQGLDAARRRLSGGPYATLAADPTSRPLRALQVSLDDVAGGGARAALELNGALRRLGHDSTMFVANRRSDDPTVGAFAPPSDPEAQLARQARRDRIREDFHRYAGTRPAGLVGYGFTEDRSPHGDAPLAQLPECDVINLHWFGDLLDYRAFFGTVPGRVPVVWTLHDMNGFTGGCHWDAGCGRFAASCGACPQLGSADEEDLSRQVWRRKREAFAGLDGRLHLVSPSRWLAGEVRRSSLLGGLPVSVIPNSVDTQTFAPRDRELARRVFGIPREARVLLYVADSLITVRKGFALLAEALSGMGSVQDLHLLSLGNHNPSSVESLPHAHLGYVEDDLLLSHVYSAADVLVVPSLQDNLPFTALEGMACGTPVVAFDTGGMPEIVRPGVTGALAPLGDAAALRETLRDLLLDDERRRTLAANCRRELVEGYARDVQAGRYVELYRALLRARLP